MQRQPVKSSNIAEVGFDKETGTVEVLFRNDEIYRYGGVPEELYQSMLGAESVGSFFNTYIKRAYPCRKVEKGSNDATKENVVFRAGSNFEVTDKGVIQAKHVRIMPSPFNKDKADGWDSNEERLSLIFSTLAYQLTEAKPIEPGDLARHYAIVITELEKAHAYYNNFILGKVI